MDIDDILAEVDSHAIPRETRDLQELTRAWVTERSAPEILPWPDALMERILERIRRQVCRPYSRRQAHWADTKSVYIRLSSWKSKRETRTPKPISASSSSRPNSSASSSSFARSYALASRRSTLTPSTISRILLPKPASHPANSNTLQLIRPYCTHTTIRPSSRGSLLLCRRWMIRLGASVW